VSDYDITYVTRGSAEYVIDGRAHTLFPGDLVCLGEGAGKEARTWPDRLMHCFSVNFSPLRPVSGEASPAFPPVSRIGLHRDLVELFRELIFSWVERQEGYIMKTRGLLLLILHRIGELTGEPGESGGDYRVRRVCRYIAGHYGEKLTVKKLAALVDLNPVYFGALFKRETGSPVHHYIARTRVRHAENMLQSGEYRVGEAAEHCGYRDEFHFYKQFKALMGFPPSRCIPRGKK
jgi:AraC-like DNA-binding protein